MYIYLENKPLDNQQDTQVIDNQTEKEKIDFILVGQGIAGTILAYSLIKQGKSVKVIDKYYPNSASRVAAGLYNPVVFKLFTKSWKIDEALPYADIFYAELESFLKQSFYHKKRIHKVFGAEEEKQQWVLKKDLPNMQPYINPQLQNYFDDEKVNQPFGSAVINGGGYMEVNKLLTAFRNYLSREGSLIDDDFSYEDLVLTSGKCQYKGIIADKVIFCEGYGLDKNPFFKWLAFKYTKGEILTINAPELNADEVMNRGVFVLPLGGGNYRVGATYNWDDMTDETTEQGKQELLAKLNKLIKTPYTITNHIAGIRPTTKDRRPILGLHPIHKTLGVFNGLGTKGVQLAPYFANEMVNHLMDHTPLDKEVDIKRFFKKFIE